MGLQNKDVKNVHNHNVDHRWLPFNKSQRDGIFKRLFNCLEGRKKSRIIFTTSNVKKCPCCI